MPNLLEKKKMKEFVNERLADQTTKFFDPITKLKLGTSTMQKTVRVQTNGKTVQFSAQSDIFAKVTLIQQRRDVDLKEVFCYPLGPVQRALADAAESKTTTPKSKLIQHLEKGTRVEEVPQIFCVVIDGMALVRQAQHVGLTFNELDDTILQCAFPLIINASRIDIIFDVYRPISIKNAERGNRSVGKICFKAIVSASKIKQWGALLSDGDSKMELIRSLVNRWRTNSSVQVSIPLYIAYEDKCICINGTGSHFVTELEGKQEEADTRMLLHAKHASHTINNIIIHTHDTDLLLIAVAASTELKSNLFIRTDTKAKSRLISMNK